MIIKLVVLDGIDETERQRTARLMAHLKQAGNSFPPAKESSITEFLIEVDLWKAVGIDNCGAIRDQLGRQTLSQRQPLADVIAEQYVIDRFIHFLQRSH